MDNNAYLLALHSVDGLGPIRLKSVLKHFKNPKAAWEGNPEDYLKIGIPKNVVNLFLDIRKKLDPQKNEQLILSTGIKYLTIFDEDYPKSLSQIYDPPTVLYYKGEILQKDKNAIGVVGTRKITGYGKVITEQFTKDLVDAGLTIVSGLARGVDTVAHLTALKFGGRTIAVLGGGLNNIFPPENTQLVEKIAAGSGAVVSEYPPDYPSLAGNFPARNRIISGLSKAVLVTEAAEDSGSLITAKEALDQGKEVFAIPGPITSFLSKGPIDLIKKGAKAVTDAKEILDELGIKKGTKITVTSQQLSDDEKKVLEILENETLHLDEIGRILSFPSSKVSALMLKMEIIGLVQSLGSGNYCKQ
jgi:DNA processing protein